MEKQINSRIMELVLNRQITDYKESITVYNRKRDYAISVYNWGNVNDYTKEIDFLKEKIEVVGQSISALSIWFIEESIK